MLIGIYENGEMVNNPKTATATNVSTHQTKVGFEIRLGWTPTNQGTMLSTLDSLEDAKEVAILTSRCLVAGGVR